MLKITIHEPAPLSAVSYYRSVGTFSYLYKINNKIQIDLPTQISWKVLANSDIFYIERPHQKNDIDALELARDFNVKTWIDFDDLFHCVPEYNPCYRDFFRKDSNILKN